MDYFSRDRASLKKDTLIRWLIRLLYNRIESGGMVQSFEPMLLVRLHENRLNVATSVSLSSEVLSLDKRMNLAVHQGHMNHHSN